MTKQSTKPIAPKQKKAKVIAKKAPRVKKPKSEVGSTVEVNSILEKMNSKVRLTDDAVQLLNAYLTSLFTTIASKAETIVKQAQKHELSCEDVKEAVKKVF